MCMLAQSIFQLQLSLHLHFPIQECLLQWFYSYCFFLFSILTAVLQQGLERSPRDWWWMIFWCSNRHSDSEGSEKRELGQYLTQGHSRLPYHHQTFVLSFNPRTHGWISRGTWPGLCFVSQQNNLTNKKYDNTHRWTEGHRSNVMYL